MNNISSGVSESAAPLLPENKDPKKSPQNATGKMGTGKEAHTVKMHMPRSNSPSPETETAELEDIMAGFGGRTRERRTAVTDTPPAPMKATKMTPPNKPPVVSQNLPPVSAKIESLKPTEVPKKDSQSPEKPIQVRLHVPQTSSKIPQTDKSEEPPKKVSERIAALTEKLTKPSETKQKLESPIVPKKPSLVGDSSKDVVEIPKIQQTSEKSTLVANKLESLNLSVPPSPPKKPLSVPKEEIQETVQQKVSAPPLPSKPPRKMAQKTLPSEQTATIKQELTPKDLSSLTDEQLIDLMPRANDKELEEIFIQLRKRASGVKPPLPEEMETRTNKLVALIPLVKNQEISLVFEHLRDNPEFLDKLDLNSPDFMKDLKTMLYPNGEPLEDDNPPLPPLDEVIPLPLEEGEAPNLPPFPGIVISDEDLLSEEPTTPPPHPPEAPELDHLTPPSGHHKRSSSPLSSELLHAIKEGAPLRKAKVSENRKSIDEMNKDELELYQKELNEKLTGNISPATQKDIESKLARIEGRFRNLKIEEEEPDNPDDENWMDV